MLLKPTGIHREYRQSLLVIIIMSGLYTNSARADYCQALSHQEIGQGFGSATSFPNTSLGDRVILSADSAENDPAQPENIRLNGTIEIQHQDGQMSAENAIYNATTNTARVDGNMVYESEGLKVQSSNSTVNLADGTFSLGNAGYELDNGNLTSQGNAAEINRDKQGLLRLLGASYSTCPPGDDSWKLSARELKLDSDNGVGSARGVTLRFKNVPILYTPIFSFPIGNQRKSGLLPPRFDQSDQTGFEYRQPFYWNIKPNWDATFVTRTMSERGLQIQTEVRHLNRIGTWTLNHETINSDRRFQPDTSRRFSRFTHDGALNDRWTTQVDLSSVSDNDYFEDLGDTLKIASITHLQRRADLTYTAENYRFRTRLLSYQTVDLSIAEEQRPYRQLPQLTLNYRHPVKRLGVDATIDTEWVYFDRNGDSITGSRLDIKPRVEWTTIRPGWFTSLATSWRNTRYDLSNATGIDQTQHRNVPLLSADAGLFFQRFNETDQSTLTLEPRLFYLYAKKRIQSELPIFDTGALDFNFSQLFRENRFSGADRINDANQLSLALSSRLVTPNGQEKFSASVGQIIYFADRQVTLPDDQPSTSSTSDIIAELETTLNRRWSGSLNLQWDPNDSATQRSSTQIKYNNGPGKLVNFGHRFLRSEGEFAHFSFTWPIGDRWRLATGWNYSLDNKQSIETVVGVEYDSCCWAFRTAARRYITDDGEDSTDAVFFELVLKGLAPVGQNVTEVLSEAIGGYSYNN